MPMVVIPVADFIRIFISNLTLLMLKPTCYMFYVDDQNHQLGSARNTCERMIVEVFTQKYLIKPKRIHSCRVHRRDKRFVF